jgi:hypothetical protein
MGMPSEVVNIKALIRPMRGGSQAHMVAGDDGRWYVAKFAGNPQGNRTLINECSSSRVFQRFGISTPPIRLLYLSESIQEKALLRFSIGNKSVAVAPGLHFGSQCPVNPNTTAIFDFLPRKLLSHVVNLEDFAKAFVLDKLLGNADSRQAIFVRASDRSRSIMFRAWLIDHGMTFGGSRWELQDIPQHGLYMDRTVYALVDTPTISDEAVDSIRLLSKDGLNAAAEGIPSGWFSKGENNILGQLFEQLQTRAAGLEHVIKRHLEALPVLPRVRESREARRFE